MKRLTLVAIALLSHTAWSQLTPAVAVNMRGAMEEIRAAFTAETGIPVTPSYSASGKLVAQIRNGAPFDLFISADLGWAESCAVAGLAACEPKIYAYGAIAMWTLRDIPAAKGIGLVASLEIKRIAIGDLALTVYGPAAKRMLERAGLWTAAEPKCVFASTINHVALYVSSGAADLGFVAVSSLVSDEMKGRGTRIDPDSTLQEPLPQAAIILRHGAARNADGSKRLYDFLFAGESRGILARYGYGLP